MFLTATLVQQYHRDGYLRVENVFTGDEVAAMLDAVEHGDRVARTTFATKDAKNQSAKLAIWFELGEDIWSAVSTSPRLINGVRILLGEDASFFHGKVILKEARQGGAWEWHQDYGYWYDQGFAFPRLISASVALDAATRENGCLEVLRGSHRLGRVTHGRFGTQTGIDPARMKALEPMFERVRCEMTPGSVLFFHCNLLHSSGPNLSPHHRRSVIMCYNAVDNPQIRIGYEDTHGLAVAAARDPCPVSADDAILRATGAKV